MGKVLEFTFLLILVMILVSNADGAQKVIIALFSGYARNVQVLQGRTMLGQGT